jgi:nucleotide-binding universal stress UspA family protein
MNFTTIESIFHPTDFSNASRVAFEHALKLALLFKAELRIMHVAGEQDHDTDWKDFAGVRDTLARWRLLPADSPRHAVSQLGIEVEKVIAQDAHPVRACLHELERHPTDLIVLAAHPYDGRMTWMRHAVAEPLARAAKAMTLFIPHGAKGFVNSDDGTMQLRSVLIPVDIVPSPSAAIDAISRLTHLIGPQNPGTVTTLHVGGGEAQLRAEPETTGWRWDQINRDGSPAQIILQTAYDISAELIAMTTQGRHGFLDLLRGSTTERILHGAQCPVLAIPANPGK